MTFFRSRIYVFLICPAFENVSKAIQKSTHRDEIEVEKGEKQPRVRWKNVRGDALKADALPIYSRQTRGFQSYSRGVVSRIHSRATYSHLGRKPMGREKSVVL